MKKIILHGMKRSECVCPFSSYLIQPRMTNTVAVCRSYLFTVKCPHSLSLGWAWKACWHAKSREIALLQQILWLWGRSNGFKPGRGKPRGFYCYVLFFLSYVTEPCSSLIIAGVVSVWIILTISSEAEVACSGYSVRYKHSGWLSLMFTLPSHTHAHTHHTYPAVTQQLSLTGQFYLSIYLFKWLQIFLTKALACQSPTSAASQ